jgi:hypothetical protein
MGACGCMYAWVHVGACMRGCMWMYVCVGACGMCVRVGACGCTYVWAHVDVRTCGCMWMYACVGAACIYALHVRVHVNAVRHGWLHAYTYMHALHPCYTSIQPCMRPHIHTHVHCIGYTHRCACMHGCNRITHMHIHMHWIRTHTYIHTYQKSHKHA